MLLIRWATVMLSGILIGKIKVIKPLILVFNTQKVRDHIHRETHLSPSSYSK
jgi:hypothetical protein